MNKDSFYTDSFHTDVTYRTCGKKKKFIDYDKPYLDLIGPNVDISKAKEILKRFRHDFQISLKKSPNAKEKEMWKMYWNKEK